MLARKALAGTAGKPKVYVEDVFSTYLYTGTDANQSINNGIDLAGKGGLVWNKVRGATGNTSYHYLVDTVRGRSSGIASNATDAEYISSSGKDLSAFTSTGYDLGPKEDFNASNFLNAQIVSWTFRKAEKFFDVVTYTGNGTSGRTVAHNLGSTPGCIIIKCTSNAEDWVVYHRSLGATEYLQLQSTGASAASSNTFNDTEPTSTNFTVNTAGAVNLNGRTYVAYLFAHNAGGFGDAGSDNVISCGSWTADTDVNLGYEPQWILYRNAGEIDNWKILDNMRGFSNTSGTFTAQKVLNPNTSGAEGSASGVFPNATGFTTGLGSGTFIYIAIRRGPMKTPTSGTSVFSPIATSSSAGTTLTTSFPVDLQIGAFRSAAENKYFMDRLRGVSTPGVTVSTPVLYSTTSGAEVTNSQATNSFDNTSFKMSLLFDGLSSIFYNFRRAPGFFDVVCYTGTGTDRELNHNLAVVPELIIAKSRSTAWDWRVISNFGTTNYDYGFLNLTNSFGNLSYASDVILYAKPDASKIYLGPNAYSNYSGDTYVAYLFASLSGVSKVGSYTGNGSSVTVTTDFQPRFILVKRTNSTGNWIVGDSARGLPTGNDPALFLNSTAAETTGQDWVDVSSTGFTVNETALNANVNTGTYLYLAIS